MSKRDEEWKEIERRAHAYLSEPRTIPATPALSKHVEVFRLWHYPAFAPYRSWAVCQVRPIAIATTGGGENAKKKIADPSVRQVTWDRRWDIERLRNPLAGLKEGLHLEPKIEVRDRQLEASELRARLDAGRAISMRMILCESQVFLDGASFGFEDGVRSVRLEWNCGAGRMARIHGVGGWNDEMAARSVRERGWDDRAKW